MAGTVDCQAAPAGRRQAERVVRRPVQEPTIAGLICQGSILCGNLLCVAGRAVERLLVFLVQEQQHGICGNDYRHTDPAAGAP